jgi:hypothetical protein
MERQLVTAMKEIRELAKKIKTLQEQHNEDENLIKAKEQATKELEAELESLSSTYPQILDGRSRKDKDGRTLVRKKSKGGRLNEELLSSSPSTLSSDKKDPKKAGREKDKKLADSGSSDAPKAIRKSQATKTKSGKKDEKKGKEKKGDREKD